MSRASRAGTLLLTVSLPAAGGCEGGDPPPPAPWGSAQPPAQRTVLASGWDTLWAVGGEDDDRLLAPTRLRAWPGGLVLWDVGGSAVVSLDASGRMRWRAGRAGSGPGEFRNVRDLRVGRDGTVWVLDVGSSRITRLGSDGGVLEEIRIPATPGDGRLVVLEEGFLLVTSATEDPILRLDARGRVVGRRSMPWAPFSGLSLLVRQGEVATEGSSWVYGFTWGNGWFPFEGWTPLGHVGRSIEHQEMARTVTRSSRDTRARRVIPPDRCGACSLDLDRGRLWLHFGGASPEAHRWLDVYDFASGRYGGSFLLPSPSSEVAVEGEVVYALVADPWPVLRALRIRNIRWPSALSR